VPKGEFLGIIGRNGSGKSTLLKIIAGILKPNSGKVSVNGTIAPFLELGVGFQPDLSARDNVYLYGAILGLSRQEIDRKFESIIKFAELEQFVDQKLKNFSSGMQVRLAFATAIQAEADTLLLDEVLAVGDMNFQKKCYEVFKEFKLKKKTIIYVSHNLESVKEFCSTVVLLDEGQVVSVGVPEPVVYEYHKLCIKETKKILGFVANQWGSREVKIDDFKIIGQGASEQTIFSTNEEIILNIRYSVQQAVEVLHFGVGIYRSDGTYCLGVNTLYDSIKVDASRKQGSVRLGITAALLKGSYYVNIVSFGMDEKDPYHFLNKAGAFEITDKLPYRGLIDLKHNWKID